MDIKCKPVKIKSFLAFKESTHFDSSKKVTASISKKNAPSKKQSKKKSLKDNGFVSNLAYITQQNKNSEIQDKKSTSILSVLLCLIKWNI